MSLKTRARTWCAPGGPLAVGGPSQKIHSGAPSRRRIDSWKTSRSRQRSSTRSSSCGKDTLGSTAIGLQTRARVRSAMAPSTPFQARVRVTLRWRDLDMLGHMNQSVYHELLEEGRSALFEEGGRLGDFAFVIARVELDYRSEVRKDHGFVDVIVRPASIGRSSIIVDQAVVLPDGTVAAEGRAVLVAWDPAARRSRSFTDGERTKLQSLIGS